MEIRPSETLRGEGFALRPIREDDAGLLVDASVTDVPDWTFIPRNLDPDAARAWMRRGMASTETGRAVRFVIETPEGSAGTVGAEHPSTHDDGIIETFYFILPAYRRRGLATAALRIVNEWAQRAAPELRRLQLHVIVGNAGSGRVAELAGYRFEGVAVNAIPSVNGYGTRDAEVYGMAVAGSAASSTGGVLA